MLSSLKEKGPEGLGREVETGDRGGVGRWRHCGKVVSLPHGIAFYERS